MTRKYQIDSPEGTITADADSREDALAVVQDARRRAGLAQLDPKTVEVFLLAEPDPKYAARKAFEDCGRIAETAEREARELEEKLAAAKDKARLYRHQQELQRAIAWPTEKGEVVA